MPLIEVNPLPPDPTNSGNGGVKKAFDQVTFVPDDNQSIMVFLKLEGAWKRTVGLKPDVNRASCSYLEFAKLGKDGNRTGKVQFWYSTEAGKGQPDVTILGETIIAVESMEQGETADQGVICVEYRVFFADFREQWIAPRGGRLEWGAMNAGPNPKLVPSSPPIPNAPLPPPEVSLRDLISFCLAKMGLDVTIPGSVDNYDAPRDLQWFGNHAPTELEKLLGLCGVAFVPELTGFASLQEITTEGSPKLPAGDALPEQVIPQIDRRGTAVVFSSYPRRNIVTFTSPAGAGFYFVLQDSNDQWVEMSKCDLLKGIDPAVHMKQNWIAVDEKFRERVTKQAYRCLQDSEDPPDPTYAAVPLLTRRLEKDLKFYPIQVRATIARPNRKGIWRNTSGPIDVQVLLKTEQDVLMLEYALVTVSIATEYPDVYFAGPSKDFTVRASFEDFSTKGKDSAGKTIFAPQYSHFGFSAAAGGAPIAMSDGDTQNAIDGKTRGAIILLRPHWWTAIIDKQEVNKQQVQAEAAAEAAIFLRAAGQPTRILGARGFAPVPCSGLVSEVQWDQQSLKTTVKVADWYSPLGALQENSQLRDLEEGKGQTQAFPNQAQTQAAMTSMGASGSTQPVYPIQYTTAPPAPPGARLVYIDSTFAGAGFYSIEATYGSVQQMGQDAIDGKDLKMPEGLKKAGTDNKQILVNLFENGLTKTHIVPIQSYQIAWPIGTYQKGNQTNEIFATGFNNVIPVQVGHHLTASSPGGTKAPRGYYDGKTITGGVLKTANPAAADLALPESGEHLAATYDVLIENLAESTTGDPHNITFGTIALGVLTGYMSSETMPRPVVRVYVAATDVVVQITAADSGDAQYTGNILGTATSAQSGNAFTMPAGMLTGTACLICNLDESGLTGHRLKLNTFLLGKIVGEGADENPIVFVHGGIGATDSPMNIPAATAVSGMTGPGTTATWVRDNDGVGCTVDVACSGTWDSSAGILYYDKRVFTYDARGLLVQIDVVTSVAIDTTAGCT